MCLGCLRDNEVQYSQHIGASSAYLSLADFALLTFERKKHMYILFYDDEHAGYPVHRSLLDVVNDLVASHPLARAFELPDAPDMSNPDTWTLACCRADFQRGQFQQLNHYLPVFTKEQLAQEWGVAVMETKDGFNNKMTLFFSTIYLDNPR